MSVKQGINREESEKTGALAVLESYLAVVDSMPQTVQSVLSQMHQLNVLCLNVLRDIDTQRQLLHDINSAADGAPERSPVAGSNGDAAADVADQRRVQQARCLRIIQHRLLQLNDYGDQKLRLAAQITHQVERGSEQIGEDLASYDYVVKTGLLPGHQFGRYQRLLKRQASEAGAAASQPAGAHGKADRREPSFDSYDSSEPLSAATSRGQSPALQPHHSAVATRSSRDRRLPAAASLAAPPPPAPRVAPRNQSHPPRPEPSAHNGTKKVNVRDESSTSKKKSSAPSESSSGGKSAKSSRALVNGAKSKAGGGGGKGSEGASRKRTATSGQANAPAAKRNKPAAAPVARLAAAHADYSDGTEKYCLCAQASFGEMICCDNDKCAIEWFHFSCVDLTVSPRGKWYCPKCRLSDAKSNVLRKDLR